MEPIIEIKGLKKKFGDFSLKGIDLSVEKGNVMGFIGPNGAGKSTTIKLVLNLLRRDAGDIKIFGLDNTTHEMEIKRRLGFVFDECHFYEELTIEEMKRIIKPFYNSWNENDYKRYLKDLSLPKDKKVKELSKGMQMKMSLLFALSHNAELLIMDEPTSGLDPVVRNEILDILRAFMQDGNKGIFLSTHITSDLEKIADYVALINDGEIVLCSDVDNLMNSYGLVKGDKELLNMAREEEFISVKENRFGFEGLVRDKEKARRLFGSKTVIDRPSLEDIMLYFTRRSENV